MTTCDPQLLNEYLDERLSPQKETVVEAHLTVCDACRDRMAEAAASGDDWTQITSALRCDEYDSSLVEESSRPAWPLKLLGPTDDPRMLGRIGPFEVSGCVGVGGMGVVFKARDPALDRYVAVKVLAPHLAASENARARFAREAKAAAAVVHDHVIAVHQVSEYQGLPYLVMPYLPGPSLEDRLQRQGRLAPVEALRIARQVAAGLAAAHEQGLIHRDIKPANIMLSGETERAVITDFGLARAADDATLTQSGTLAGTPQFMAPEQARGDYTDARSDLFSLGSVLFTMLTGEPPFPLLSGSETIRRVGQETPPKIDSRLADVPSEIRSALERLHAFDPDQRVTCAKDVQALLDVALANAARTPLVPLPDGRRKMARGLSKRRGMIGGAVVVGTLAVALWAGNFPADPPVRSGRGNESHRASSGRGNESHRASSGQGHESLRASSGQGIESPNPTEPSLTKSPSTALPPSKPSSTPAQTSPTETSQPFVEISIPSDQESIQLDIIFGDLERRLDELEHR